MLYASQIARQAAECRHTRLPAAANPAWQFTPPAPAAVSASAPTPPPAVPRQAPAATPTRKNPTIYQELMRKHDRLDPRHLPGNLT